MDESWNDIPLYTIYQNNIRKLRSNCDVSVQLIIYCTYSIIAHNLYSFRSLQNIFFAVRMSLQPAGEIPITVSWRVPEKEDMPSPYHCCS